MDSGTIRELARECGFELAGVAPAAPLPERAWYREWVAAGFAGEMSYLTGRRGEVRDDPRNLLPSARSIICVGKLYQTAWPYSTSFDDPERAWISRYAWGDDYHDVMRRGLERLDRLLRERWRERGAPFESPPFESPPFESKICVDTAPLLERSYARMAGLGWIGKNTCLINQRSGSWFFLGELLVSVEIEPEREAPPDRCGTCMRCIDACPTAAIVPGEAGCVPGPAGSAGGFAVEGAPHAVDSRLCISYFTIELRGGIPEERRTGIGRHVFGCDICQDVCPWNRRAPVTGDAAFAPRDFAPSLERLASLTEDEFRAGFRGTPVTRAKYAGFLRNVAVAMGNARREDFRAPLERLARSQDPVVAAHARWGLEQLGGGEGTGQ